MADNSPNPASSTPPSLLAGKRVLLAEDSRAQQRLVSYLLTKAGVTVVLAQNGQEAVDLAGREPFDAVLLDMQMPQMDGYEAATVLRRQGYRGPIVALTADTLGGDQQRCLQAGCDDYLAKPVQPADLLGLLLRHLAAPPLAAAPAVPAVPFDELLRQYVSRLSEKVKKMRVAEVAEDRATLAQLAHKTRGSAAMYGFTELSETAGLLEDAAREGQDRTLLRELLDEMDGLVRRIERG
jgi:CheY-like chemotaxis protein/HPt (histidine-containing phosphotransfer) domain-containing protein